ncbi:hypothetical protein GOODEAATRI_019012 [Goodea atripinnis]|uniref:Uncharacterized protein n=1 Tax=Goodea atripinnis TaxID=208336 RepID=A0ABV0NBV6_9TELE
MKDNSLPRILVILLSVVVFVDVLVINALAGAGRVSATLCLLFFLAVEHGAEHDVARAVQNGLAVYTTWSSIASLLNLSVVLHLWGVDKSTAATASLCILFAELLGWFILESWVLDRWVRNILTVYPVVIVALTGNVYKHFNPADPTPNSVFMVIWRNKWRPLHSPGSARLMVSPLDGSKFGILK